MAKLAIRLCSTPITQKWFCHEFNPMIRTIATSSKKTAKKKICHDYKEPAKPWVSYGFDFNSQKDDTNYHKASFFFSVTLCLVGGSFVWAYAPDCHMRDWAQREAFLELRRREKDNKPAISPHFINPKTIKLPSENDLRDVEVLI